MATTLKDFAVSMRRRAARIETLGNDVAIEGAAAMLREMVEVTPVDTSEAISNWQITLGAPSAAPRQPFFSGTRGSTRGASSAKAVAEGLGELANKRPGQPLFLSNAAKHIVDLDNGSSAQFPGGFVPRALITFRLAVKEAAKRLLG